MRTFVYPVLALSVALVVLSGCDCAGRPRQGRTSDSGAMPDLGDGGMPWVGDGGPVDPCDDGLDGDADGRVDEGCSCMAGRTQRCFPGDPELAGVGACGWGSQSCSPGLEFGMWDSCEGAGEPSVEVCDGVDNDCDGVTDPGCACLEDAERPCYTGPAGTAGVGLCRSGAELCVPTDEGSMWGACGGEVVPSTEICDGVGDEDCDGRVDEGCECAPGATRSCFGGPAGAAGVGICRAGTQRCFVSAGSATWGPCEDEGLPRTEFCTGGLDEDCDGAVDCADRDCDTHPACCTPLDQTAAIVPPDAEILFVVDRSGSMNWPAVGTARSRWEELQSAMATVLPIMSDLPMGMLTFPMLTGDAERLSCVVASTPEVGIARGAGPLIQARLLTAAPRAGDTPTPDAFATVRSYIASHPSTRRRYVVLATDGLPEPNCGATVSATSAAIRALRADLGVDTFVLGIVGPSSSGDTSGIPALRDALNQFADAGGRARAGSLRYYEAVDGPALERSMRAILAAATDCTVEFATAPARPGSVEVRIDGALVPPSGYTLTGRRIELHGSYCTMVRGGMVRAVTMTDRCGG